MKKTSENNYIAYAENMAYAEYVIENLDNSIAYVQYMVGNLDIDLNTCLKNALEELKIESYYFYEIEKKDNFFKIQLKDKINKKIFNKYKR